MANEVMEFLLTSDPEQVLIAMNAVNDGTTQTAIKAGDVKDSIGGVALNQIFETDNKTAKEATHSLTAEEATHAESANVFTGDDWKPRVIPTPNPNFITSGFLFKKTTFGYEIIGDIRKLAPKDEKYGKAYYIDKISGTDSNNGLTYASALESLHVAAAKSDVDVIYVAPGEYPIGNTFNNISPTRNIIVKALSGGSVIFSSRWNMTWNLVGGKTYTYQGTAPYSIGLVRHRDYTPLTRVNSIDEAESLAGSYYINGTTAYLHTLTGDSPNDTYYKVFLNRSPGYVTGNVTVYCEGITFDGGDPPFDLRNGATGIFVDCKFIYGCGSASGGLSTYKATSVYLEKCYASNNINDGFNYHSADGVITRVIEANCVGINNGSESDSDNGSTVHDGISIIRVNGIYGNNKGPNIQDIGTGTLSWNVGCTCYGSNAVNPDRQINFMVGDGTDSAKMWLDGCISYESTVDIKCATGSEMYIHDLIGNGQNVANSPIAEY
jgi:hypothetical protein